MPRKNKQRRWALRAEQPCISPWTQHQGLMDTVTSTDHTACPPHRNSMCPNGRALQHPAANFLKEWATFGCPTQTGKLRSKTEMWEAVDRGPHSSARLPEASHVLKSKLQGKCKQIKHNWCYGISSKTIPKRAQDIVNCGHSTQIQGFPIHSRLIILHAL